MAHLVARGYTNKQIAEHLFISHRTVEVETHLHRIYHRFGLANRADLASGSDFPGHASAM